MLTESVLVKSVDVRLKKNGGEFLGYVLQNSLKEEMKGVSWENVEKLKTEILAGYVYTLNMEKNSYLGETQYTIFSGIKNTDVDPVSFLDADGDSVKILWSELLMVLTSGVGNPCYANIIDRFLSKKELVTKLINISVTKSIVSYHVGGLIGKLNDEIKLAEQFKAIFPELDLDLVITALLCRYFGKLYYEIQGVQFVPSLRNRLVDDKILSLDFIKSLDGTDEYFMTEDFIRLESCITAKYEFASRMFFESHVVAHIEMIVSARGSYLLSDDKYKKA